MKKWEQFEINVADHLNDNIGNKVIRFERLGSSNSNEPDIQVYYNNKINFNIECKLSTAQSSQFVVLIDLKNKKFECSPIIKSNSLFAKDLISHMNNNFEYYAKTNDSGNRNNKLFCEQSLIDNYVIKNLEDKSTLVISSDYIDNFSSKRPLTITHVNLLPSNYKITGTYRSKYSGSRNARINEISDLKIEKNKIKSENGFVYIYDPKKEYPDYLNNDRSFFLSKKEYLKDHRRVKIPSNVFNSNVIFTLKLKESAKTHTNLDIIKKNC